MAAPTITHRVELGWRRRTRTAGSSFPSLRSLSAVRSVAATVAVTVLRVTVTATGRVRTARSKLLHVAAVAGFEAGLWDLAGRGWALIALLVVLPVVDLALTDIDE